MADLSKELNKELSKDFAYCEDALGRAENAIGNLPSVQPDTKELIAKIKNGISATNADDVYSCGMRNGMRWVLSLVDGKEPSYE